MYAASRQKGAAHNDDYNIYSLGDIRNSPCFQRNGKFTFCNLLIEGCTPRESMIDCSGVVIASEWENCNGTILVAAIYVLYFGYVRYL